MSRRNNSFSSKGDKMFKSTVKNKAGSTAGTEDAGYGKSHFYSKKSKAPAPAPKKVKG